MEHKIRQTAASLAAIGLEDCSRRLRSIQALYKQSFSDFSREINILNALADISQVIADLKLHQKLEENLFFPAFAIETSQNTVMKESEPLQGYSKQEILIGMSNYLNMFTKHFMKNRLGRLTFEEQSTYKKIMEELQRVVKGLDKARRILHKGLPKQPIIGGLSKMARTAGDIYLFIEIAQNAARREQHPSYRVPTFEKAEQEGMTREEYQSWIRDNTWIGQFETLDFDLEREMRTIEDVFMSKHDLSKEELWNIIKNFRSEEGILQYKKEIEKHKKRNETTPPKTANLRFAADDEDEEDEFDLNDIEDVEFEDADEDADEDTEEEVVKDPSSPREAPKFRGFMEQIELQQAGYGDPTDPGHLDYKHIVQRILSSRSLARKPNDTTPFRPATIQRAFRWLRNLWREQYMALLRTAYELYTNVYHIETMQRNLGNVLRNLASSLETLYG